MLSIRSLSDSEDEFGSSRVPFNDDDESVGNENELQRHAGEDEEDDSIVVEEKMVSECVMSLSHTHTHSLSLSCVMHGTNVNINVKTLRHVDVTRSRARPPAMRRQHHDDDDDDDDDYDDDGITTNESHRATASGSANLPTRGSSTNDFLQRAATLLRFACIKLFSFVRILIHTKCQSPSCRTISQCRFFLFDCRHHSYVIENLLVLAHFGTHSVPSRQQPYPVTTLCIWE